MNSSGKNTDLIAQIFAVPQQSFNSVALEVFRFQYQHNKIYKQYCDLLGTDAATINSITRIPFLPISFFKTHQIQTTTFEPEIIFESSGTTQSINSRHLVKELNIYQKSFTEAFKLFYGSPANWCIIALLPSYLERQHSSLVMMAEALIKLSGHPQSGFYLYDFKKLAATLQRLEAAGQPTLLLGVTFALLDFAEQFPLSLRHTTIMETGGMKGRKTELTRQQVHHILNTAFGTGHIHSEYGMTELLSQAYAKERGIFNCPPWMKVLIRAEDDPFDVQASTVANSTNGAINIIDLANLYSCSFIATEDAGRLYANGRFEVLGRLDNSDIRGCSLMAL